MTNKYYDVIVIGGGHAGCEAACASANMGARTLLITMDMNKIAQMSCNPAIGGIAKGQIVREIDALGGQMGLVTDATAIQFRMLNRSKGPAVWSPRAQCDRGKFIWQWRKTLDETENLDIWQDQVDELIVECVANSRQTKRVVGVKTIWGAEFRAPCIVLTAGTFLNGLMHIGRRMVKGGRIAEPAAERLTESITQHGIRSARMKTGTPVRIDKRSVHFEDMRQQDGENDFHQFSYFHPSAAAAPEDQVTPEVSIRPLPQLPCWECYTNPAVHETLRSGLADSPLYNGQIQSIGPRYCPSIETKLVTFPDREQHLLFLEPEGTDTNEMYLNGFSSSLPMDIQIAALRHIPALRDVKVYRPGYAIEYDFFDPTQLEHTLESRVICGLFLAGQVNGTTGYEEAGGQGTLAGINAALKAGSEGCGTTAANRTFTLARDEAYIGVLIDDLVTKGVDEPYRMFTSRAEYRIILRQDDADTRLTERGYELGIVKRNRYNWWLEKKKNIEEIVEFCQSLPIKPSVINGTLEALGSTPIQYGCKLTDLIARPELSLRQLEETIPELKELLNRPKNRREEIREAVEVRIKYKGYIDREKLVAEKMHRLENIKIRGHFDYENLNAISTEARQKMAKIQPETLAQASRIPGVSPSDINAMLVLMGR